MKRIAFTLAAGLLACGLEAVVLERGRTDVVIASDAPKSVEFAACEMTNFLSRALGGAVPVVSAPAPGRVSVVLGVNKWAKAAGLRPENLPRDGFEERVTDGMVLIAGVDSPDIDFAALVRNGRLAGVAPNVRHGERGTLFGVYDFLERHVGCRFYFPGELGEVVPRRARIEVPAGARSCAPVFKVRDVYLQGDGVWPGESGVVDRNRIKCLDWLRLRLQTESIPCCHGLNNLQLSDRFGATHPEWFCLTRDQHGGGLRRETGTGRNAGSWKNQMCFTNDALWDQIFADIMAYFAGEDPAARGIRREWNSSPSGWGPNFSGRYVDIMAQDGMQECFCDKCQAAYDKSRGITGYATELIWGRTAALARRLADAGCPAIVTQMSYSPYRAMPSCELPSNVWVMVARNGPWSVGNPSAVASDKADIAAWAEKLGHKVWMWTYPAKHSGSPLSLKGPPDYAPRAWHSYYKAMAPWSMGSFAESESVNSLVHYMNYYVFSKLAWDLDVDIDALLDEHYRLMYGAAAAKMKEAFETFERKWIGEIAGNTVDTPLGPKTQAPSRAELWTNVYPEREVLRLRSLFDEAAAAVPKGSLEARRIALMRGVFLDPLVEAGLQAAEEMSKDRALARRRAAPPAKNLLANGSFDPDGGGWNKPSGLCGYDTSTFVSPPASFRVSNTNGVGWSCCTQPMEGKFKDDTTYRVSFFVKLDDVRKLERVGHSCWAISYYNTWFCKPGGGKEGMLLGTADWFYYEGTFKTGKRKPDDKTAKPYFSWGFNGKVIGTAWVDDIVIEEIPDGER